MKLGAGQFLIAISFLASVITIAGCNKSKPVSYTTNIKPIFEKYCNECHLSGGKGETKSGFSLASYQSTLKGTKFGPVIIPGDSLSSTLVILIEKKADPSINMPHGKQTNLSKTEIQLVKDWINQGAKNN